MNEAKQASEEKAERSRRLPEGVFESFRMILRRESGIEIGPQKMSLVESRLLRRMTALGCKSFRQYLDEVEKTPAELQQFVFLMTTNKTDWFREPAHLEFLKKIIIPERPLNAENPLMVWSAASSSGEEAYSIGITALEAGVKHTDIRILGSDINESVVKKAREGWYKADQVQTQVPGPRISRWFDRSDVPAGYRVKPELRALCKFREYNLISSDLPVAIEFDVIFLRNVLIYFAPNTIETVINRLTRYLRKGGYLIVGHSESLLGVRHTLEAQGGSIFRKKK